MTYAAPNMMKYGRTAIVCLAKDLDDAANSRDIKRRLAGDDAGSVSLVLAGRPINLTNFFSMGIEGKTNRLIIVAHGDSKSTGLFDSQKAGAKKYEPQELAELVWNWVGRYPLGTVSLDACYSGGNRAGAKGAEFGSWQVDPSESFAYEFASHFGIADRVTGRTDRGTAVFLEKHDVGGVFAPGDMPSYNTVGGGRYHELWDKIIITPDKAARPSNRVAASLTIHTKGREGAKPPQPLPV